MLHDYSERINELNQFCDDDYECKVSLQSIDNFHKVASDYDKTLGQAHLIVTYGGILVASWVINKHIEHIEIECRIDNYHVITFYSDTLIPDIFDFNIERLREYLDRVIKNHLKMRTCFPIYGVPGENIVFDTEACLSIGKYSNHRFVMGFKIHVSNATIGPEKDTGQYIMDAIKNEGWNPVCYEHVLYDEAFVTIRHTNEEMMTIHQRRSDK